MHPGMPAYFRFMTILGEMLNKPPTKDLLHGLVPCYRECHGAVHAWDLFIIQLSSPTTVHHSVKHQIKYIAVCWQDYFLRGLS